MKKDIAYVHSDRAGLNEHGVYWMAKWEYQDIFERYSMHVEREIRMMIGI